MESRLIGFVRKGMNGKARITLSKSALDNAETVQTPTGGEYIYLAANGDRLVSVMNGSREVVSIQQIKEE